jgi:HK97 family phage prohead protease
MLERLTCALEVEAKLAGDTDAEAMTFSGYGAVFGNVDSYGDVILKGAFKETIREAKRSKQYPAMLLQHGGFLGGDNTPVGIWLDLEEDDVGL